MKNQGLLQTLEKFQVLQTWIIFLSLHHEKKLDLYDKPEKNPGDKLKKNPGVQDLKFFQGLKQTLISQDLDFQKSRFRLKGRLY